MAARDLRVGYQDGWVDGQRAMWQWLDAIPRYDIEAKDGGCIVILDLRKLADEFPQAVVLAQEQAHGD